MIGSFVVKFFVIALFSAALLVVRMSSKIGGIGGSLAGLESLTAAALLQRPQKSEKGAFGYIGLAFEGSNYSFSKL